MEHWSWKRQKVKNLSVLQENCVRQKRFLFEISARTKISTSLFGFLRKMEHWSRIESKTTRFYKRAVCVKNDSCQTSRRTPLFNIFGFWKNGTLEPKGVKSLNSYTKTAYAKNDSCLKYPGAHWFHYIWFFAKNGTLKLKKVKKRRDFWWESFLAHTVLL